MNEPLSLSPLSDGYADARAPLPTPPFFAPWPFFLLALALTLLVYCLIYAALRATFGWPPLYAWAAAYPVNHLFTLLLPDRWTSGRAARLHRSRGTREAAPDASAGPLAP